MPDYEDPGWRGPLRGIGWFVLPIMHLWTAGRIHGKDGLTALRTIFLALVDSLFLFLIAFAYIAPWNSGNVGAIPVLVALTGSACLLAVTLLKRRPLVGETPANLAASYRASLFLGIGFSEIPALLGLGGTLITQSLWIYLVGMPFALAGFVRIAPTRANIERRQEQIQALGSPLSLGQALLDSRPPGRN